MCYVKLISPAAEAARIRKALRDCKTRGLEVLGPGECIKKAVAEFGNSLSVSCSFGACSVVVLHMTLAQDPGVKVVFCNTGVQYAETYRFRDRLTKEWSLKLIETRPIHSFWYCVKRWGFPAFRSAKGPGKPQCCTYLKDYPMRKACRKHEIKACITGMRAAESRARMFNFGDRGQYYYTKKYRVWKVNPIAFWTHKEVWAYIREHDLPTNELYSKGHERSGCMPCTGYKGWEKMLARANPKLYRYVQKLRGVALISDYLALEEKAIETACGSGIRVTQKMLQEWF